MKKELEITKEKLNTLEQAWDNISATGIEFKHFLKDKVIPKDKAQVAYMAKGCYLPLVN